MLSICLTTTIMGWKTEIWGFGGFGEAEAAGGLWDGDGGWRGRGVGVNIVMISPEFRSFGPMRRERDRERKGGRERAAAVLSPPATLTAVTPPPPPPPPHNEREKREGCCEKIEMLTHTHQTPSAGPSDTSHRPIRVLTERRAEGFLS